MLALSLRPNEAILCSSGFVSFRLGEYATTPKPYLLQEGMSDNRPYHVRPKALSRKEATVSNESIKYVLNAFRTDSFLAENHHDGYVLLI